jgi:HYR domain/Right handed beta helix region
VAVFSVPARTVRRLPSLIAAAVLVAAMLLAVPRAFAADIPVADTTALQSALITSVAGDVILLQPGVVYMPATTLTVTKNLTIRGPATSPGAAISGQSLTTGDPAGALNLVRVNAGVTLTLENAYLTTTPDATGAVVDAVGAVVLTRSTIATGLGVGVAVRASGSLTAVNSTIADNGTSGISVTSTGVVSLTHSTVSNNGTGAILAPVASSLTLVNSVVHSPNGVDCLAAADTVTNSQGSDSPATCGAGIATGLTGLRPLTEIGGPTPSVGLTATSSALDAGATSCAAVDQRGRTRSAAPCDIGAVERDRTAPTLATRANITTPQTAELTPVDFTHPNLTDADGFPGPAATSVVCTPVSGSGFPVGTTPVSCIGTNLDGLTSNTTGFTVTVTTPPSVTVPANRTVGVAQGATGAVVTYPAPTTTNGGSGPTCTSSPTAGLSSGSTFPLGITTIQCTSTNSVGSDTKSFTINVVEDTTAPVVTPPANRVIQATGPTGAVVTYPAATANDNVAGSLAATCAPPSGSTFALGLTTVTCTATDTVGNTGSASFTVTVNDTTAPAVTVPSNLTVAATGASGAAVTYSASATDSVGPLAPAVTCAPASGATFAVGTTSVTCSSTDAAGNTGSASFSVTVTALPVITQNPPPPPPAAGPPPGSPPPVVIATPNVGPRAAALSKKIKASKIKAGDKAALTRLLARPTCASLGSFVARAKVISRKKKAGVSAGVVNSWSSAAQSMRRTLGC